MDGTCDHQGDKRMPGKKKENIKEDYDLKPSDFNTSRKPTWCTGCGNFAIWNAMKKAFVKLSLHPHQVLVVYGIGCSGNGVNFLRSYSFHSLHGRALPIATGAKIANHKMDILAVTGDGDGMGIGGNHFIHTCRRNINITNIVHDNHVYGLTTGQTSPTSGSGFKSKSTPTGALEAPVNPISLALAAGATFVARGFSGDIGQLAEIIRKAIKHRGFSFIDILQPCVTFNKIDSYDYYREKVYSIDVIKAYDRTNLATAFQKSIEEEKIPTGIFYQVQKPTYEDGLKQIDRKPLTDHIVSDIDINKLFNKYY
jgi:2-oxoglutarate/2-oxoacid ferredoxin oxidoreductase subunit beta